MSGLIGAERYERGGQRSNYRNGYRVRGWDTREGTIELAVPKVRTGTSRLVRTDRARTPTTVGSENGGTDGHRTTRSKCGVPPGYRLAGAGARD